MKIGKSSIKSTDPHLTKTTNLNDLTPQERRKAMDNFDAEFQQHWMNQQHTGQGLTFPSIASKYGNIHADNDKQPDPKPPAELFNFDLILNNRRFQVLCDTLIRINREEDLADFSQRQLENALEMCASYRMTCFCAYVGAHREYRKWREYHALWMAEKREEARKQIKSERMIDKAQGLKRDIGQITIQEVEDFILIKHGTEYKHNLELIADWKDNEQVFLELRDTLKDRGMHLQTLLRRVYDHIDPNKMSDGSSTGN